VKNLKISKPVDPARLKGVGVEAFQAGVEQVKTMNEALAPHRGVESSCWVCGSDDKKPVASVHGIDFVQCQNCTHVYQSRIIPYEVLRDYFADDEDINVHVADGQFEYRIAELSAPKVETILDELRRLGDETATGRWLDCGCGAGDMLYVARNHGWHAVGFDVGKAGVEIARRHQLAAYCCDLSGFVEGPFATDEGSRPFDVITAFGYFDVLTQPTEALQVLRSMLRPGGYLCMHQPHFDSITHDLNRRFPEMAIRYLNAGQRSSFTRASIERFLGDAGFDVVFEWRFGLDMYNLLATTTLTRPGFEKSAAYDVMLERFNEFQSVFDAAGKNDTMMVLARLRN
jgi:SAM-dependent methyltransferase